MSPATNVAAGAVSIVEPLVTPAPATLTGDADETNVTPAGNGSLTVTPWAVSGPLPVTVSTYAVSSKGSAAPTCGASFETAFVNETLATAVGLIVTEPDVEVPPEALGLVWFSTAVLTIDPEPAVTSTVTANCSEALSVIVPIVQVTMLFDSVTVVPPGTTPSDTKTVPAGRGSVTTTPAAELGPLFVTLIV
jgi:hypothetical protein